MRAIQSKTLAAFTSFAVAVSAAATPVSALTVPEAITSIQSSNPSLPSGVPNPKGNIGFLLANMFWNSSDVGYDSTKFGKIKPTYFDGAGATAWTYAAGNTYMTDMEGRVGIGTNDPQAYLHLKSHLADHSAALLLESPSSGSSSPRIALVDTSSGSVVSEPAWLLDNSFDRFRIFRQPNLTTPGLAHFTISWSGNTAVGNSLSSFVPSATFEVRNTSANSNYAAWIEGGNSANYGLGVNVANTTSSKGIANFKSNNVSRLFVRADGNVGVGTTSPDSTLDVNGDISGYTRFKYTSVNGDYFWLRSRLGTEPNALSIGIGSDETTGTTKDIRMLTNGVGRFYIWQDGKVWVGTLSPSTTLDVNGQIRIAGGVPGAGKILTSDAVGLATWTSPSAAYTESDPKVATTSTGYLARWNGSQLVNSNIIDDGTNVGVGIWAPYIKLAIGDSDTGLDWVSDGKLDVYSNNVVAMAVRGHKVGFGTSAPSAYVHSESGGNLNNLTNTPSIADIAGFFGYSATDGIGIDSNQIEKIGSGPLNVNYNSTSNLILNYGLGVGGNVGIGITNPTQKLEVAGVTTSTGFRANQWAPDNSDSSTVWYAFGADGDTGIFSPGSGSNNGQVGVFINNVERFRVNSTGVGIGTSNPSAKLEVVGSMILNANGASDGPRLIWRGGASGLQEYRSRVSTSGALSFFPAESGNANWVGDVLVLTQSGNVGVAWAMTPSASLEVKRTISDANYAAWIEWSSTNNYGLGVNTANTSSSRSIADFKSGNVSRLYVRADGNVGIGTNAPGATLNVVGTTHLSRDNATTCCATAGDYTLSLAELTNSSGKMSSIQFHNSGVAEGYIRLSGSGARRFQMGDNQGVTMGLQMSGNLQVDGTGNSYVAGNMGIGTSSPWTKLEVAGQVKITGGSPGAGKVLTSDASGLATWTTPATGGGITAVTTVSCWFSETTSCTATCAAGYYRTGCSSSMNYSGWTETPSGSNACVFSGTNPGTGYAYCAK